MDKFFANLTGKDDKKKPTTSWQGGRSDMSTIKKSDPVKQPPANKESKNLFANANSAIQKQMDKLQNKQTVGKSLGGSKPGAMYPVTLSHPGPLGIEIEKRRDAAQSAIIASVIPQSQAHSAGLKRGDIICRQDSDTEYSYNEFLTVAKSGVRPLTFNIRRMESSSVVDGGGSADAMHRKQAMIAAAEAREAKNKALVKPVSKLTEADRKQPRVTAVNEYLESNNAQTKQAVEAIKAVERSDAEILGYNPYESRAMTGGQARTATVAMTAGDIKAENAPSKLRGEGVRDSSAATDDSIIEVPQEFDYAFSTMVVSSSDQASTQKSLGTMRKLIINATTKGQNDNEESSKFRRVRLSNPKIKEVITDVQGALELMMAVGFVLSENEEDGETYLVYPPDVGCADWLGGALERMERYERGG
jgi:hypothetical protein